MHPKRGMNRNLKRNSCGRIKRMINYCLVSLWRRSNKLLKKLSSNKQYKHIWGNDSCVLLLCRSWVCQWLLMVYDLGCGKILRHLFEITLATMRQNHFGILMNLFPSTFVPGFLWNVIFRMSKINSECIVPTKPIHMHWKCVRLSASTTMNLNEALTAGIKAKIVNGWAIPPYRKRCHDICWACRGGR